MEDTDRLVAAVDRMVGHLHDVVREYGVKEHELRQVLGFLTELGTADEWPLMADVLGISVAVDDNTHAAGGQETASNVEGPFWRPGAPMAEAPVALCGPDEPGDVLFFSGQVVAADDRRPLAGALLDVWQTNQAGWYDHQDPGQPEWNLRRRFGTDAQGRYEFRTIVPAPYQIPSSGPVGRFLAAVGRHPWRPAHLHVKLTHEGFRPLTTMLYFEGDPWLGDDTISSVKPELTVALAKHDGAEEIAARGLDRPFFTSGYDFALAPA
jgi:catechol 1,2-dioxygenase